MRSESPLTSMPSPLTRYKNLRDIFAGLFQPFCPLLCLMVSLKSALLWHLTGYEVPSKCKLYSEIRFSFRCMLQQGVKRAKLHSQRLAIVTSYCASPAAYIDVIVKLACISAVH